MNKVAFLLVLIPLAIFAVSVEESFASWAQLHGKSYNSQHEYNARLNVYRQNLKFIEEHNRKNVGFVVAMNQFGDLSSEEFGRLYNNLRINATNLVQSENVYSDPYFVGADTVDWRTKGVVTAVKNQGQCGSCWAFSATGSMEGAWALAGKTLTSLSEQNLVDCSTSQGNEGCDGGLMDYAFQYVMDNKGIDTETSYKYTARDGTCKFTSNNVGTTISSFVDVKSKDETSLQSAIQNKGPISVAIDASRSSFQFYHSGVYNEPKCSSSQLDHGVLAVGYGTDSSNKDYYIVKNSWGTSWGMNGYILMTRNKNNQCGIATAASYPVV